MFRHTPIFRRPRGSRPAALTATALAATLALGVTTVITTTAAAPPAAAAPTCTPVDPATLSAQVTQPTGVWDPVGVTFSGTLPNGYPADACVVIPSTPDLPLRAFGRYDALDPAKARVGSMIVDGTGITFTFEAAYLASHTDVTFGGQVQAGMNVDANKVVTPFTLNWDLPGKTPDAVVNVPACPNCGTAADWGYKYAVIDETSKNTVFSGVVFGQNNWQHIPPGPEPTVKLTMSDQIDAGHVCKQVTLFDVTVNPPNGQFIKSYDCPATVTFDAIRGHAYKLAVNSTIIDPTRASYADTGTVSYNGSQVATYTATAPWALARANGDGTRAVAPGPGPNPNPNPNPGPTPIQFPLVTPSPTVTTPAPSPTKPPVITLPVVATTLRTYQVDRLTPRTAAQAAVVARLDDDGILRYREDRPLWGASRYQMITMAVPVTASPAWVLKALNARTTKAVGDLVTTKRLPTAKVGGTYVMAWELGKGASVRLPWGPNTNVSQRYVGRG